MPLRGEYSPHSEGAFGMMLQGATDEAVRLSLKTTYGHLSTGARNNTVRRARQRMELFAAGFAAVAAAVAELLPIDNVDIPLDVLPPPPLGPILEIHPVIAAEGPLVVDAVGVPLGIVHPDPIVAIPHDVRPWALPLGIVAEQDIIDIAAALPLPVDDGGIPLGIVHPGQIAVVPPGIAAAPDMIDMDAAIEPSESNALENPSCIEAVPVNDGHKRHVNNTLDPTS